MSVLKVEQLESFFTGNGKIWVVILVIALIFIGLMVYLYRIDRKVSRLKNKK